ncbi:MAG: copper chaperone [Coriobacteriaceae bacterium]|nr:copper chaperone [Coriobacteriaceae bacterium]
MATKHVTLKTTGMHCMSCSMLIQMNVGDLEGVEGVKADLASGTTEVDFDPDKVDIHAIIAEIVKSGYGAEVAE